MSVKSPVRAWKLTPIFDPKPGQICNAGTTTCIATGKQLLGTDVGEALAPEIVRALRKSDKARTVCDAELLDAAIEFLKQPGLYKVRIDGKMLTREEIAARLAKDGGS